jgi:alkylation response protein AidB-like acyl-CoA dehydrogenase
MDVNYSKEDMNFREEAQHFFAHELPGELKEKLEKGSPIYKEDQILWQKTLAKKGWAGINWPVEYGGTGWTVTQKAIFAEEQAKHDAPRLVPFGLELVAPVIIAFGNDAQKKRFLPDILESNVWWCQGYSEPGAGSDLASLKTRAIRDGDYYIVNGQKTWTTYAQYADWIFCLVRTDPLVKNQLGISFLLIDMQSSGIEVRPIKLMDGGQEVNEVYFDNVKVPVENRIGEENKGWTYAKYLLTHERTMQGEVAVSKRHLEKIRVSAAKTPAGNGNLMEDPSYKKKVAEVEIELMALEYTYLRILSQVATGGAPGAESSILKIRGTEIQQKLTELRLDAACYGGFIFNDPLAGNKEALNNGDESAAQVYFDMRKTTIYAGSTQIQKGIIAKAVLGL